MKLPMNIMAEYSLRTQLLVLSATRPSSGTTRHDGIGKITYYYAFGCRQMPAVYRPPIRRARFKTG